MGRLDDWPDEPTPVADITDPKRTALEAELQVALSTVRGLQAERVEHIARIRSLEADVRRLEHANRLLRRK